MENIENGPERELVSWMDEIRAAQPVRRQFEVNPLDAPAMTPLQITGSTDQDHADRLLRALGHDPKDAR